MAKKKSSFIENFGKVSPPKPKKAKPIKTKRVRFDTIDKAVDCKDRIEGDGILCENSTCKCNFKTHNKREAILQSNQIKIRFAHLNNSIKLNKYELNWLDWNWLHPFNDSAAKTIYKFIIKSIFIHGLDLIVVSPFKNDKVKSAFEAFHCKDRKPDVDNCCKCHNPNYRINVFNCYCHYSKLAIDELGYEVAREIFIHLLKNKKLSQWDKIVLTWDWSNLSNKQIQPYNSFILNHIKLAPIIDEVRNKKMSIQDAINSI